jgi:tRNA threonylcarbamoyladenosine biosynthesis protein TsaE
VTTDQPEPISLLLRSQRDTQRLGRILALALQPGDLVLLEGELGAGKTYLVKAIVRALGVPSDQPVTSPTFEILHEFHGRCPIVHADLYRLDPSESLEELGLSQRVSGDAVVLIEWGERFARELADFGVRVSMELGVGTQRRCTLRARGERGLPLFTRLAELLSSSSLSRG